MHRVEKKSIFDVIFDNILDSKIVGCYIEYRKFQQKVEIFSVFDRKVNLEYKG